MSRPTLGCVAKEFITKYPSVTEPKREQNHTTAHYLGQAAVAQQARLPGVF